MPFMALSGCVADDAELIAEAQDVAADEPAVADVEGPGDLGAGQDGAEYLPPPATLLVSPVANWKYLIQPGLNPPVWGTCNEPDWDWNTENFDDSDWGEGYAELGYGDRDETVINAGPSDKYKCITQFFRHEFTVDDPDRFASLILRLLRDDGAVVYLNGHEIARSNLPYGYIDAYTPAKTQVYGDEEDRFLDFYDIPADHLYPGRNVLAVEVHQYSKSDPDLSFNLELSGVLEDDPWRQTLSFASQEATIDESRSTKSLGGDSACKADGASGEDNADLNKEQVCLSQWDLMSPDLYWQEIPPSSRVVAAHLVTNVVNPSSDRYKVFPLMTPWLEGKATWNDPNGIYMSGDWETGKFSTQDLEHYPVTVVNALKTGTRIITLPPWLVQQWIDDPYGNAGLAILDLKHVNGIDFAAGGAGLKLVVSVEPNYEPPPTEEPIP